MLVNVTFEAAAEQIRDVAKRFSSALRSVGISFRVVGGFAVFLQVEQIDPLAARLTPDVDVAIDRSDLEAIRLAVEPYGFKFRHLERVDMFFDPDQPRARSSVHIVFINEKVRPEYLQPVPASQPVATRKASSSRQSRTWFV